jgi:hypothetical protein
MERGIDNAANAWTKNETAWSWKAFSAGREASARAPPVPFDDKLPPVAREVLRAVFFGLIVFSTSLKREGNYHESCAGSQNVQDIMNKNLPSPEISVLGRGLDRVVNSGKNR